VIPATPASNSLQAAADTFDDLFQIVPDQPPAKKGSQFGSRGKQDSKASKPKEPFKGLSWTPQTGKQNTRTHQTAPKTLRPPERDQVVSIRRRQRDKEEQEQEQELITLSDEELKELEEEKGDNSQNDDPTMLDGISLLMPQPGETTQRWYENLVMQNREPEAPSLVTPDVDISSDLHSLFGIDRAQQQNRVMSGLGALQREPPAVRPAVKKGKVDYQINRILRKHGGAYSHVQPSLMPTDLMRMRPSQVALLAMSRRTEASTYQRKQFDAVISSTLKSVDKASTVQQRSGA
jgi:hypothetical protein